MSKGGFHLEGGQQGFKMVRSPPPQPLKYPRSIMYTGQLVPFPLTLPHRNFVSPWTIISLKAVMVALVLLKV